MRYWLCAAIVAAGLTAAGCGMQPGSTVAKLENGALARETEVIEAGSYALYDSYDTTPQIIFPLDRGDPIGFREENGQTVAVAGSRTIPLETGNKTYFWKKK